MDTARRHAEVARCEQHVVDDGAMVTAAAFSSETPGDSGTSATTGASGTSDTLTPGHLDTFSQDSFMLLHAARAALAAGATEVIWPIQLGGAGLDNLDIARSEELVRRMALAADRALLCSRLATIDAADAVIELGGVNIQTPMLEFADRQIVDLALDLGVPMHEVAGVVNHEHWLGVMREMGVHTLAGAA